MRCKIVAECVCVMCVHVCIVVAGVLYAVGFDVNVKDLYHGTTCPLDQICAEGLDPRISVHGHFGRGIYFRFTTAESIGTVYG